jgi:hypothetical protein
MRNLSISREYHHFQKNITAVWTVECSGFVANLPFDRDFQKSWKNITKKGKQVCRSISNVLDVRNADIEGGKEIPNGNKCPQQEDILKSEGNPYHSAQ